MSNLPTITYMFAEEKSNIKEQIKVDENVYVFFQRKLKIPIENLCILCGESICKRSALFSDFTSQSQCIFILYDMKKVILELEDEKQRILQISSLCQGSIKKMVTTSFYSKQITNSIGAQMLKSEVLSKLPTSKSEDLDNVKISIFDQIIQGKSEELKKIQNMKATVLNKHNNLLNSQSLCVDLYQDCYFCEQKIDENFLQTSCNHSFHEQCLNDIVEFQLNNNGIFFQCQCGQKQKFISLDYLTKQKWRGKIYKEEFLQHQVEQIKQKYQSKFRSCGKCDYFFMRGTTQSRVQIQCPYCN